MVERNYNLIELGPWGTGKSFIFRESSPNAILISGGKVTVAQLFVNLSSGRVGLLGMWDVVAFDEVAGLEMSDSTVINMLKDFMESGSFARGKEEVPTEASIVFIGNTSKPHQELVRTAHLFADLPKAMIDPAFLDRLHYYLPGWEAPKLEKRLFTDHFGFVSDYFAEALRQLRKQSQVRAIDSDFALGSHLSARDEKAVRKTVSGSAEDPASARRVDPRGATRVPRVRHGGPPARQGAAQEARRARLREDRVLLRRARYRPRSLGRGARAARGDRSARPRTMAAATDPRPAGSAAATAGPQRTSRSRSSSLAARGAASSSSRRPESISRRSSATRSSS